MKLQNLILVAAFGTAILSGCGDNIPVNPMPKDGSNPHVDGSPQERITRIQNDSSLSPQEKEQRIKAIKERNHLQ